LANFAAEHTGLDYDSDQNEIYLYHGTNCFRRWEINRLGSIEPGRNHYSFFSSRATVAFAWARAACARDLDPNSVNSLTCEPVVLKVRFTARTWLQVDFIEEVAIPDNPESKSLSLAVLGSVSSCHITDVLHCMHGKRLGYAGESIRIFADGTLLSSIQHLRVKLRQKRPDAWMLKHLEVLSQTVGVRIAGKEVPELTFEDNLRKLRQIRA
jgi:hypothetical protein